MNETRTRGGPNLGLLLLIPAVVIIAKTAARRAAMERAWDGPGGRYGRHHTSAHDGDWGRRSFRLPPRIEAALDDWHTRTHEASEAPPSTPAPDAPAA